MAPYTPLVLSKIQKVLKFSCYDYCRGFPLHHMSYGSYLHNNPRLKLRDKVLMHTLVTENSGSRKVRNAIEISRKKIYGDCLNDIAIIGLRYSLVPLTGQKSVQENLFHYFFLFNPTRITRTFHDTKISILKR